MSEKELSESNAGNDMPIRGAIPQKEIKEEEKDSGSERKSNLFSGYTLAQLKEMMDEAVLNEDYERASLLRDEMSKRD
jgi:protein-arginine kinase activator protein McsA